MKVKLLKKLRRKYDKKIDIFFEKSAYHIYIDNDPYKKIFSHKPDAEKYVDELKRIFILYDIVKMRYDNDNE